MTVCRVCGQDTCPRPVGLPNETRVGPVTGYKWAYIVRHGDDWMFRGPGQGHLYLADDEARCRHDPDTPPPHHDHPCGFNAHNEPITRSRPVNTVVTLTVELSGRYIRHEHGWRASRQRVTRVELSDECMHCGGAAETLTLTVTPHKGLEALVSACRLHTADEKEVSVDELAEALNCEVVWAERREQAVGEKGPEPYQGGSFSGSLAAQQINQMIRAQVSTAPIHHFTVAPNPRFTATSPAQQRQPTARDRFFRQLRIAALVVVGLGALIGIPGMFGLWEIPGTLGAIAVLGGAVGIVGAMWREVLDDAITEVSDYWMAATFTVFVGGTGGLVAYLVFAAAWDLPL